MDKERFRGKRIVVADISGAEKNGKITGHLIQVAKDYYYALSKYCVVMIAGQKRYSDYFDKNDLIMLPYANDINQQNKIIRKIREVRNAIYIIKEKSADAIVFQQYSRNTAILLALLLTRTTANVYLIQYYLKNKGHVGIVGKFVENVLFVLCNKKINGIICSMDEIGQSFSLPYFKITDYIYTEESRGKLVLPESFEYDFGMIGRLTSRKGVEELIYSLRNTSYKVLLAGCFDSDKYKTKIEMNINSNITIEDKYFTYEEYINNLNKIKYVVFPYPKRNMEHSSGSILDAVFHGKPVICSMHPAFDFVKKYNLGFMYKEHMYEFFDVEIEYNEYCNNIRKFVKNYEVLIYSFLKFIFGENSNEQ